MKIALATTTIHVPHALKLLRKCNPDVMFFIAGDRKSPDHAIVDMLADVPNHMYFGAGWRNEWKCSKLIGENTLAKRNLAFLEALRWGADIVISWDTDNYPLNSSYLNQFAWSLGKFDGIIARGQDGWFDAGAYLRPPAKHRGFPIQRKHQPQYSTITDAKIGVAAGLILNDPDVDSMTRIVQAPDSQEVSLLMDAGVVVDPHTWTIFNTQNSAIIRDLVPAWFLLPNVGRMDDIYASMVVQRVARECNLHVHFGQPYALQQRHPHDLIKDMRAEIDGYENVIKLADLLDSIILKGRSVIEDVRTIYLTLCHCTFIPEASALAGLAYLEDCEAILG